MPEVAAQTAQFANMGAMPGVDAALGAGQIGDPALLQTLGQGAGEAATQTLNPINYLQDVNATMELNIRPEDIVDAETLAPKAATLTGNADKAALLSNAGYGPMASPAELGANASKFPFSNPLSSIYNIYKEQDPLTQGVMKYGGLGLLAKSLSKTPGAPGAEKYDGPLSKFRYSPDTYRPYTYKPYAAGGPVEEMSSRNAIGANTGYPQSDIQQGAYATPWQTPVSRNVVAGAGDVGVDQMTGMERMAGGGIANLGGYSDGGRLLKGPGDGMSDNIPATIGRKQPARLADGEFVVPADVVSGLGNGSTDAGAKQLYKMLDKVRSARTGTKKQGKQINPNKYTPA